MKKSKELYSKILEQLELGNTLASICRSKDMPSLSTVHEWTKKDSKFKDQILDARRLGAMSWLDWMMDLLTKECEPQQVQWNRERLHHARWMASKLVSVFGDKQTVVNEGDPIIKVLWKEEEVVNDPSTEHKQDEHAHALRTSEHNGKKTIQ